MKTFTIIISMFFFQNLICQEYNKFIEKNKYFDVGYYEMGHFCGWSDSRPVRYFFEGDTLINGKHYSKLSYYLMNSIWNDGHQCPPFTVDTVKYNGESFFIREDTLAQQVYRLYSGSGNDEELLFDFSLQKGDTLGNSINNIIDTVVNIVTSDGKTRKKFHFKNCDPMNGYYIEGIGGNRGPFEFPIPAFESQYFPMCVKCNDSIIYGNMCYDFVNSIQKKITESRIRYYPNPMQNLLSIDFTELTGSKKISIINCSGQLMKQLETNDTNFKMDVSGLKPGIYIIKVIINNRISRCYSVIKN